MEYQELIEFIGRSIEVAGVAVIVLGAVVATISFVRDWLKSDEILNPYKIYRENLGRAILLGLEFLLAGDIIRSVAVQPTFVSVGILAIIVLIRSFLAVELEMEIDGKWPWQPSREKHKQE
jgi:uncharacterized membrane protein